MTPSPVNRRTILGAGVAGLAAASGWVEPARAPAGPQEACGCPRTQS